jgi:signal transduction histidine kinase
VLLGAVVVAAVLESLLRDDLPLRGLSLLLTAGLAPTVLWRRTHPLVVVLVAFGTTAVVDVALLLADAPTIEMATLVWFLVLPYSLYRWGSGREVVTGTAMILVPASLSLFVSWTGLADAIGGMAVLLSSVALGLAARWQHGARRRRVEQARAEERVQLARELHDTVAHHVSAIAIQAQAGRALAATSPGAATDALEVVEAEASRTLAEMRAMVRMLRNQEPADYAPPAGVSDLERLVGGSPVGPQVEVTLSGDLGALPAAVDAAVVRIVQEAVTNARRHAHHATRVDVRVAAVGPAVTVVVSDDGDPVAGSAASAPGFGVAGMVERAALLGGTCAAGPGPDRGWTVEATLPREVAR